MLEEWKIARMQRAQFRVVGNHSAVKICHWTKQVLRGIAPCYKQSFYGIHTHKCLEMSPALTCNQRCLHCWRDTSIFSKDWTGPIDEPSDIIEGCIAERKKLLTGFGGNEKCDPEFFQDALEPDQVAISLTGEPCMYPRLNELIDEFFNKKFRSVFLVTSGTVPDSLRSLNRLPTNLYVSLTAPDPEKYRELCRPVIPGAWEKLNESLELLSKMKTGTVLRLTLIRGMNMSEPEKFVPLIEKAKPEFVECKAYMFLGHSRKRLSEENMPEMPEIRAFAEAIGENSDYRIVNERNDSRICLLGRD